jgi:hypothetical protein
MVGPTGKSPKKSSRHGENVFRIHESPKAGVSGGHVAAAFAGALASINFAELEKAARAGKVLRDMPTKGSNLTINQHTFQAQSIRRFYNDREVVDLNDKAHNIRRHAKADDSVFCAIRAWAQRDESGYMIRIETEFQKLASDVVGGRVTKLDKEQSRIVDNFYALWYMRSHLKYLPSLELKVQGVDGERYTKSQEESLEREGVLFAREGGRIPARQIHGAQIQILAHRYAEQISETTNWKIITAKEGEFVVPDVPTITAIPITPTLCLVSTAPSDGMIVKQDVAHLNGQFREASWEYFFARDFAACP